MNNQYLSKKEFMFALPSVIIGISILALPTTISNITSYSDGWIPILIAGVITTIMALLIVRIASNFPGESFLEYSGRLVTKPVAIIFTLIYCSTSLMLTAVTTRSLAYISQQYLFEKTPIEVLALSFLLVVIYAVAGSRLGLFRLNMLFLPIIIFVFIIVGLFNIKWVDTANYFPLFKTSMKEYVSSTRAAMSGFVGFAIGFFYLFMIKEPSKMTKEVIIGIGIAVFFYIFVFLISIGVFSNVVTSNLVLPTLELARKVDIPGAIFERVDAFVYTIWIMSIFNTVAILYDIAVLLFMDVFTKLTKPITVFLIAPIIYFIAMFPKSMDTVNTLNQVVALISTAFTIFVILLFYIMIKWRGISHNESA